MLRIVSRSAMGAPRGKARGAPFPVFSRSRRRRENDVYHQRLYQKLVLIKEKPTGKILSRQTQTQPVGDYVKCNWSQYNKALENPRNLSFEFI